MGRINNSITQNDLAASNENYRLAYEAAVNAAQLPQLIPAQADLNQMQYLHLLSVSRMDREAGAYFMQQQTERIFSALWSLRMTVSLAVRFNGNAAEIYFGTLNLMQSSMHQLMQVLESALPGLRIEQDPAQPGMPMLYQFVRCYDTGSPKGIYSPEFNAVGLFTGNPTVRSFTESQAEAMPLDALIAGTMHRRWLLTITAVPEEDARLRSAYDEWMGLQTDASAYTEATFQSGANVAVSMSTTRKYAFSEKFHRFAQSHCDVLQEAMQYGGWRVTALCFAPNEADLRLAGGIFAAQLKVGSEEMQRPLPFGFCPCSSVRDSQPGQTVVNAWLTSVPKDRNHPTSASTCLSGRELSMLCALPVRDSFGFQVTDFADFDRFRDEQYAGGLRIGRILNGLNPSDSEYTMDLNELNRHGLVVGLTGGGKSNTVKSLLHSVREQKIPFLVIEPAKKEYYELYRMGMTDLQVYTVGTPAGQGNPLRINPFEPIAGYPLQAHMDAVFAAFKASFIMYTPMPYVLESAIYSIYADYGWDCTTGKNRFGRTDYPTIDDLYYKIRPAVIAMGYDKRMQNDLIGSLSARINSLRIGTKGQTLNTAKSTDIKHLLRGSAVIELEDIGDEDAKAFIISLILMQLQECRKTQRDAQNQLLHLLLIEEAHRLLKNVSSGTGENADPRGAAVEYFCNMLAEVRSKGQGFLVIDQIPSKLAPDLVKNTNLKIIHRTVADEDRELVGGTMHMTPEQEEFLACLPKGVAAVYAEGDFRPKLVRLPNAREFSDRRYQALSRSDILAASAQHCFQYRNAADYADQSQCNPVCRHCRNAACRRRPQPDESVFADIPDSGTMLRALAKSHIHSQENNEIGPIWTVRWIRAWLKAHPEAAASPLPRANCMMAYWYREVCTGSPYPQQCDALELLLRSMTHQAERNT